MKLEDRLVEKVKVYLEKHGFVPNPNTLGYIGLDPSAGMPDGSHVPMHIVGFCTGEDYLVSRNYVKIDPTSEKLVMLLTPHYYELIDEDD